ncbi:hypothetical protein ACVRY7_04625 [Streptococcus ictaluri]|uniref:Uncharacterized protein n=1 Tax=Streptococcus ictaluri 707-05 TaxID=764299 RepID=G5K688_9STRE|nr:hypothetical protein [Streptococcus ictaluri]EHI68659.1 hypothetical protein STRIC_0575 [Streptococcus ictaluri 707-05]
MTYELCLEYGTYPLTLADAQFLDERGIPDFIKEDQVLLNKLEVMNKFFHELFLTIECQFHYVGFDFPEKRQAIKVLYDEVSQLLTEKYPQMDIHIEPFLLA